MIDYSDFVGVNETIKSIMSDYSDCMRVSELEL